jgi:hypothetical protein
VEQHRAQSVDHAQSVCHGPTCIDACQFVSAALFRSAFIKRQPAQAQSRSPVEQVQEDET